MPSRSDVLSGSAPPLSFSCVRRAGWNSPLMSSGSLQISVNKQTLYCKYTSHPSCHRRNALGVILIRQALSSNIWLKEMEGSALSSTAAVHIITNVTTSVAFWGPVASYCQCAASYCNLLVRRIRNPSGLQLQRFRAADGGWWWDLTAKTQSCWRLWKKNFKIKNW